MKDKNRRKYARRKRYFALAAAGVMTAGMMILSACSAGNDSKSVRTAEGRYMEEEIAIPEEVKGNGLVSVIKRPDKTLEFLIPDDSGATARYVYDGKSWNREGEVSAPDGLRIARAVLGEDGNYYYGGFDSDYVFHLWTEGENGEIRELGQDLFKVPEGEEYGLLPDFISVLEDGRLLVSQTSQAAVYQADGKEEFPIPQDFIGMDVRIPAWVSDGSYLTLSSQKVARYDLTTGEKTGSFEIPEKPEGIYGMALFAGEDGGVYTAGPSGLYHTEKNGTMWEQIIDGSLNSMGRQDLFLHAFFEGKDNDYYGIFSSEDSIMHFFHYYYDETVETVPPEILTVYALRDNTTVRQAASILQKNNPQVKVDFRIAVEDTEEEVTEDVIRALNTELLGGKGADVLILDGLPAKTYKDKGILADMNETLKDEKDQILSNIADDFVDQEGKIYYMPVRIRVPVIFGSADGVEAYQSFDKMEAYDKTPPLFSPDIYENVMNLTAYTCFKELFDENGTIQKDNLTKWLRAVKSAGEQSNLKTSFTQEEMERFNTNNYVIPDGFGRQGDYNVASGRSAAGLALLDSLDSAMLPLAAAEVTDSSLSGVQGIYLPTVLVGINASSANKETAEEFIQVLFGSEVQDESLRDGFSVRSDSLDSWAEIEKEAMVSTSMHGVDFRLEGRWPDQAVREDILAIVKTSDVPVMPDHQILNLIIDGAADYFDGKEPIEQAVQNIENKMQLYLSERE